MGGFTTGPIADAIQTLGARIPSLLHERIELAIADGELNPAASPVSLVQFVMGQFAVLSAISRSNPTRQQLDATVSYMLARLPWADKY